MSNKSPVDTSAIYKDVKELLGKDTSGHGMDHIDRVLKLAITFAKSEGADQEIVALAALLHDVDDYKIFGEEYSKKLVNAHNILDTYDIDDKTKGEIIHIIRSMGYSKYVAGIRPKTLEGMVVSDADMCDAIGSVGILRTHAYAISKEEPFFDKTLLPQESPEDASTYKTAKNNHSVQHFFDKLLKIPSILMTEAGKAEGKKRKAIMTNFLDELFQEENSQQWQKHLRDFEAGSCKQ